ncbi:MAG: hypothetical protein NUV80_02870 [Candidatus Berkelbacteria bacterium]|nr:hypothetical protein [Candidatus Berkelbacteria bacterium]
MADNADETVDSTNDTTEEVDNTEEVDETDLSESEDLEALQEKNKRLFERAKKAEAEAKLLKAERLKKEEQVKAKAETKESVSTEKQVGLTPMDTIALITAKVTEKEDIEFVAEYAQFKKIPVSEALKNGVVKSELAQRIELRTTAEATNTGGGRRGSSKPTGEQIMQDAGEGKLPDDPAVLAKARFEAKLKK